MLVSRGTLRGYPGTPRDPQAHADPRWAYPDAQGGGPWGVQGGVLFNKPPGRSREWGQGMRICAKIAHFSRVEGITLSG